MASNFNDTTPAAPAGNVNVKWQTDGAGRDSAYVPVGLSNPMTTLGDIITGGASGTPGRLGIGSTNDVLTVVAGAPAWAPPSGGGGGGSIGANVAPFPPLYFNTDAFTLGDTLKVRIPSSMIVNTASSWTISLFFPGTNATGNIIVSAMNLKRTLPGSLSVIDSTPITIGSSATPTIPTVSATPTIATSDTISKAIDGAHDYYFYVFWNASSTVHCDVGNSTVAGGLMGLDSGGDTTAETTVTGSFLSANVYCFFNWIVIS